MKTNDVLAAVVGSCFFAVPYLALAVPILPSLAIGGAAFAAGELVFRKKLTSLKDTDISLYNVLEKAKEENKHILDTSNKIEDEKIKQYMVEINDTVDKIIKTVENKPEKQKNINNFFAYYLPLVIEITDRYDEIENQKLSSDDNKKFIKSSYEIIEEANNAFKNILNSLYESDMTDTDIEMKVFNSMLKSDGIDSDEIKVKDKESKDE
jgi:5-bromo-4-chloroindolyl phosphate hydrolysis protein